MDTQPQAAAAATFDAAPIGEVAGTASAPLVARADRPTILLLEKGLLLGDALLRVPAYRAVRAAFPEHRIVGLTRHQSAFAAALAPVAHLFLDDVVSDPAVGGGTAEQRGLARRFGPVDVVIDFRPNLRALRSYLALAPLARRFVANTFGYALRKGVALTPEMRPVVNAMRFHRLAEIAAGRALPFDFTLPTLPRAAQQAAGLMPEGRYFGIAGGPLTQTKSWPREGYVAVAARLRDLGYRPVILLGVSEAEQREWFETHIPDALIVDMVAAGGDPAYLLWLLHAVAGRLAGCTANENGLGHLVASRGLPLLTLAGPTATRRWKPATHYFKPVTHHWWLLRAQDFGSSSEMRAIPPEAVADKVGEMVRWIERGDDNRAGSPDAAEIAAVA